MSTKQAGVSVGSFTVVAWQKRGRGETKANCKHYRLSASSFLSFSVSVLPQRSNEEPSLLPFSLFFYLRTCNSDLPCFRLFLASSPLSLEFVCSVLCRGECLGPSPVLQKNENCHQKHSVPCNLTTDNVDHTKRDAYLRYGTQRFSQLLTSSQYYLY